MFLLLLWECGMRLVAVETDYKLPLNLHPVKMESCDQILSGRFSVHVCLSTFIILNQKSCRLAIFWRAFSLSLPQFPAYTVAAALLFLVILFSSCHCFRAFIPLDYRSWSLWIVVVLQAPAAFGLSTFLLHEVRLLRDY